MEEDIFISRIDVSTGFVVRQISPAPTIESEMAANIKIETMLKSALKKLFFLRFFAILSVLSREKINSDINSYYSISWIF